MTEIILKLDDQKAQALKEKAERYGLEPDQLIKASIDHLVGQPDADFDSAVKRVLSKNKELYRRLA
jgi:hypothetical protein